MAYIGLTFLGIIAVLLVRAGWTPQKQLTVILAVLLGGALLAVFGEQVLQSGGLITKGPGEDGITWVEPTLYLAMIAGMMAKYFFDAIGDGNAINFQKWQFIKPIFISPIVFGVIYSAIDQSTSGLLLIIFSFQNGFFGRPF